MNPGLASLLWFGAIVALIPLTLWLLKRTPLGGAAAQGQLRSIAALPLSPSQRIVTVEVGQGEERRWLVLGVSPQSITTLYTMLPQPDAVPAPPPAQAAAPFAQLMARLRKGEPGSDGGPDGQR